MNHASRVQPHSAGIFFGPDATALGAVALNFGAENPTQKPIKILFQSLPSLGCELGTFAD
jgi:hypothetical protein